MTNQELAHRLIQDGFVDELSGMEATLTLALDFWGVSSTASPKTVLPEDIEEVV